MAQRFVSIPGNVELKDYQERAIAEWKNNSFCGYFDMATGTGKTFTALAGLSLFSEYYHGNVAAFIVCPYKHLVGQWEEDIQAWGGRPIICHSESPEKDWNTKLQIAFKRFRQLGQPFICLTTNRSFVGEKVQAIVKQINSEMNVVFVVDEAHNFGATQLSSMLPVNIKYRLALSATFERFNDETGTKALTDYFGKACIHYTLEKAISEGKALCPYEYYPVFTFLEAGELARYEYLTKKILENLIEEDGVTRLTEAGQLLVYERARLLASAHSKTETLKECLKRYKNEKYILIYCGATIKRGDDGTAKKLIEEITDIVNNEIGIKAHKFTSEEDINERLYLKEMFSEGMYQALTAIKCLDEGVNIPNIRTAFIMASSRNPKEFIQRRGRLLRKARGKEKATIYDFVVLPRPLSKVRIGDYDSDKSIIMGEMSRVYEFGRLALNPIETDRMLEDVQNAYDVRFDLDELSKYCEEELYEFD